tara:strand:+ start:2289 stop:2873 length:585 start_codon:yes stop_codon:yes gene_type:complete
MKIRKPYTITEGEKSRIMGLHKTAKNILTEDSGYEEDMNYESNKSHDDKELYDLSHDGSSQTHIDNLKADMSYDDIHDDYDMEEGMMCETCGKVHEGACGGTYEGELDEEMLTDLNGGTYEVAETSMPEGWKMVTKDDIQEQKNMDDVYEVWFGNESDELITEDNQTMYELPKRFGNKRLTETALVNMINNIIN